MGERQRAADGAGAARIEGKTLEYTVNLPVLGGALLAALVLASVRVVRYFLRRRERLQARAFRRAAEREQWGREMKGDV